MAGLILGGEDGADATLRALLPVAGQTLVEYQARLLRLAGAGHLVLHTERLPQPLVQALDRLKRHGIEVEVARDAADVADRIHPDEQLLVIADGVVTNADTAASLRDAAAPSLLVFGNDAPAGFERIDADAHWAGLALLDGGFVRRTAAMLGDWELGSTLLRRAVQEGAARIGVKAPAEPALIASTEEAHAASERLIDAQAHDGETLFGRMVTAPLARKGAALLAGAGHGPTPPATAAAVLLAAMLAAAWFGWTGTAALAFLLSGLAEAAARRVAAAGVRESRLERWIARGRGLLASAGLVAASIVIAPAAGWGAVALAAGTAGAAFLAGRLRRALAAKDPWLADADTLAVLLLLGSLPGFPVAALAAMTVWSCGSLAWLVGRAVNTLQRQA